MLKLVQYLLSYALSELAIFYSFNFFLRILGSVFFFNVLLCSLFADRSDLNFQQNLIMTMATIKTKNKTKVYQIGHQLQVQPIPKVD